MEDFSEPLISVPGCEVFVNGGMKKRVASIVRKGIFTNIEQLQSKESAQVWLRVEKDGQKVTLGNLFREWNKSQEKVIEELCQRVEKRSENEKVLLAGDFNLDPSRIEDPNYALARKTRSFLTRMEGAGLDRISFGSTFERMKSGKVIKSELDWLLVSHDDMVSETEMAKSGMSDHGLILWRLDFQNPTQCAKEGKNKFRKLDQINRGKFVQDMAQQNWEQLAVMEDVEDMVECFHRLFLSVLDEHAPLVEVKKRRRGPARRPSAALSQLRRKRDNARSKGKMDLLRELRKECQRLSREETMRQAAERLEKGPNEAWKIVGEVTGKQKSSSHIIREGGRVLSNEEAAEVFNKYFPEKVRKIQESIPQFKGDPLQGARKRAEKCKVKENSLKLHTVQEGVIASILKNMKASSCPDIYGIAPKALKLAVEAVTVPLTWIINKSILSEQVPKAWKISRVLPLHKKGTKDKKENYRPVSILPSTSKVLEEVVRRQVAKYFESNGLLPGSQFGFRAGRSTVLAAASAEHDWKSAKKKKLECGALFFDLSAAFDCINASLLVKKLKVYGGTESLNAWVTSYLSDRQQRVDYGGKSSEMKGVGAGSPQGSVISPLLFLIMVADVEEWVNKEVQVIAYADDTSVYIVADSKELVRQGLQEAARNFFQFMKAAKLSANPTKTNFLYFSGRGEEPLQVDDIKIQEKREETLLGITFGKRLSWKYHVDKLEPELRKRIGLLKRLRMKLPAQVVKKMVDPLFNSKMRYAMELTTDALKKEDKSLQRLHALHRGAMKAVLGIGRNSHPSDNELYSRTGQVSVQQMAMEATASMSWKCIKDWQKNPLANNRIEEHFSGRQTRQATQRTFPPQSTQGSLLSRMVEIWEQLPEKVKEENNWEAAKAGIKTWTSHLILGKSIDK